MSRKVDDLCGQRFGRLTVIEYAEMQNKNAVWYCKCDCGKVITAQANKLKSGKKISCGCIRAEPKENLIGKEFGILLVKEYDYKQKRWNCQCKCGKETKVETSKLKSGKTKSCGCLRAEQKRQELTKHGMRETRLYRIWHSMKCRCQLERHKSYKNYGGRGIRVCDEWQAFEPFRDWAMDNGYTDKLTIDRIDVNGNYEPSNCRWIPMAEQSKNRRCCK